MGAGRDLMYGSSVFMKGEAENQREKDLPEAIRESVVLVGFELEPSGSRLRISCAGQHRPGCAAITNNPQVSVANESQQSLCSSWSLCPSQSSDRQSSHPPGCCQSPGRGREGSAGALAPKCSGPGVSTSQQKWAELVACLTSNSRQGRSATCQQGGSIGNI